MGICKYCGEDAGFFGDVHPACQFKHDAEIIVKGGTLPPKSEKELVTSQNADVLDRLENAITAKEMKLIKDLFFPLESVEEYFDTKLPVYQCIIGWLGRLSEHENYVLCEKLFPIIDEYIEDCKDPHVFHMYWENRLEICWKNKDTIPTAFNDAKRYSHSLIGISNSVKDDPVIFSHEHIGYKRMLMILAKEKDFEGIIKICKKAKSEGWRGDWDNRIEKARQKLEK